MASRRCSTENLLERGFPRERILSVYSRYVSGESIKALLEELEIELPLSKFTQLFWRLPVEEKCRHCSSAMLQNLPSKTHKNDRNVYCSSCDHRDDKHCRCSGCREENEEKLRRDFYNEINWTSETRKLALLRDLGLKDLLSLYALTKYCREEHLIAPLYEQRSNSAPGLMPTQDSCVTLLRDLMSKNALFPSPCRNIERSICWQGSELYVDYGYFHWLPFVALHGTIDEGDWLDIDQLNDVLQKWFDQLKFSATSMQMKAVLALLREIAVDEAWKTITNLSEQLYFDADQRGGKLEQLIEQGAIKFTPGRFHYFCSKSVRDAYLAYKEKRANSRSHAINMVPWRMERLLERCEEERWNIRPTGEPRLQCRLEVLAQEVLAGNLGIGVSMTTHSPLEIEAAMREAGYLSCPDDSETSGLQKYEAEPAVNEH